MSETSISKRIKDLRISQGMTLEQVANEVGVGKSTVRKWETGMIANMRRDKIVALAKALHTTPLYLMGIEEKEDSPTEPKLGEGEKELIQLFQLVPEEDRPMVLRMIRAAIDKLQ